MLQAFEVRSANQITRAALLVSLLYSSYSITTTDAFYGQPTTATVLLPISAVRKKRMRAPPKFSPMLSTAKRHNAKKSLPQVDSRQSIPGALST